jgi:hypothetical protein
MKKVKSGNRSSAAKGIGAPKDVDEYLAGVPEPARSTLNKIRAAIRSAVPRQATETISYRIPVSAPSFLRVIGRHDFSFACGPQSCALRQPASK